MRTFTGWPSATAAEPHGKAGNPWAGDRVAETDGPRWEGEFASGEVLPVGRLHDGLFEFQGRGPGMDMTLVLQAAVPLPQAPDLPNKLTPIILHR